MKAVKRSHRGLRRHVSIAVRGKVRRSPDIDNGSGGSFDRLRRGAVSVNVGTAATLFVSIPFVAGAVKRRASHQTLPTDRITLSNSRSTTNAPVCLIRTGHKAHIAPYGVSLEDGRRSDYWNILSAARVGSRSGPRAHRRRCRAVPGAASWQPYGLGRQLKSGRRLDSGRRLRASAPFGLGQPRWSGLPAPDDRAGRA